MSGAPMFPGAWRCDAHQLWTNGDCPDCDVEQIADLDETYLERDVRVSETPGGDTGWHRHDNGVIHRDDARCTWLGNPVPCPPPDRG